jgi:hypothetical protein
MAFRESRAFFPKIVDFCVDCLKFLGVHRRQLSQRRLGPFQLRAARSWGQFLRRRRLRCAGALWLGLKLFRLALFSSGGSALNCPAAVPRKTLITLPGQASGAHISWFDGQRDQRTIDLLNSRAALARKGVQTS